MIPQSCDQAKGVSVHPNDIFFFNSERSCDLSVMLLRPDSSALVCSLNIRLMDFYFIVQLSFLSLGSRLQRQAAQGFPQCDHALWHATSGCFQFAVVSKVYLTLSGPYWRTPYVTFLVINAVCIEFQRISCNPRKWYCYFDVHRASERHTNY